MMSDSRKIEERATGSRICPECGVSFYRTHGRQNFCSREHQTRFHNLMSSRGRVLLPLTLVSRSGKNGRTEDTAYAFRQASLLADQWNIEDRKAGRDCRLIVASKREMAWSAADIGRRGR